MATADETHVEWAGFRLPEHASAGHFLIVGAPGSGKTLIIRGLIASIVTQIHSDSNCRAVISDADGDGMEFLTGLGITCPIYNLNPFVSNAAGWDISGDWTDISRLAHYAAVLIPDSFGTPPHFFIHAARHILREVLANFVQRSSPWSFRDLVEITTNRDLLIGTLAVVPEAAKFKEQYIGAGIVFDNICETLATAIEPLRLIAASYEAIPVHRRLQLKQWNGSKGSILLLQNNTRRTREQTILNELILQTIADQILARPESRLSRTWFFLDNVGEAECAAILPRLMELGRSRGVQVALTCRCVEELCDAHRRPWGLEIAGMASNLSILRMQSKLSAEWAAALMGKSETFEYRPAHDSRNVIDVDIEDFPMKNKEFQSRAACTIAELVTIPLAQQGRVSGFHMSPAFHGAIMRETQYDLSET